MVIGNGDASSFLSRRFVLKLYIYNLNIQVAHIIFRERYSAPQLRYSASYTANNAEY